MKISRRAALAKPVQEESIPPHLRCSSCSQLLINGFQTPHGCRLCENCVNDRLKCPCTRGECPTDDNRELHDRRCTSFKCIPDLGTRRELGNLSVRCPNAGCEKQTVWKELELHLDTECKFEHVTCELCGLKVISYRMNESHKDLRQVDCCYNLRTLCPYCKDPTKLFNQTEFFEHSKTCPEVPSNCKYIGSIGCKKRMPRSQLDKHYSHDAVDEHISLLMHQMNQQLDLQNNELRELRARIIRMEAELAEKRQKSIMDSAKWRPGIKHLVFFCLSILLSFVLMLGWSTKLGASEPAEHSLSAIYLDRHPTALYWTQESMQTANG